MTSGPQRTEWAILDGPGLTRFGYSIPVEMSIALPTLSGRGRNEGLEDTHGGRAVRIISQRERANRCEPEYKVMR